MRLWGLPLKVWSSRAGARGVSRAGGAGRRPAALGRAVRGAAGARGARARPLPAFDVRLAAHDVRAGIAHVGALEAAGLLNDGGRRATRRRAPRGRRRDRRRHVRVRRRRRGRALGDRARRDGPARRPRRAAARRPEPQRPRRDRPSPVAARGRPPDRRPDGDARAHARRRGASEHAETVVPGHDARAARAARDARPSPAGARVGAGARPRAVRPVGGARRPSAPLGAGALGTSTLGLDPAATAERLGFAGAFANSIDAVSDRDFALEFLGRRVDPRHAPVAAGGRPRPVDRRVARLGGARRGLRDRVEHDAAEAEPRHRRARSREGRARGGRLRAAGRRAAGAAPRRTTATSRRTRSRCSTRPTRSSSCCRR